jgi:hypothetical protein
MAATSEPDRPDRDRSPLAVLPVPGNAELLVYAAALAVAAIVTWIDDGTGVGAWLDVFKWATAAYLISRGIAKASRVYEY